MQNNQQNVSDSSGDLKRRLEALKAARKQNIPVNAAPLFANLKEKLAARNAEEQASSRYQSICHNWKLLWDVKPESTNQQDLATAHLKSPAVDTDRKENSNQRA
jgi:hypothetical protein